MKRVGHLILLAMLALGTVARAQEEDDDPKSKPPATAKARTVEKAKPKAEPKPESKAEPKSEVAPKAKVEPVKKAPIESRAESKTEVKVDKIADEPPVKKEKVKPLPKLARAPEAATADVVAPAPESQAAPRSVRVRLVDGSTVVGSVRAEQVDALVVDCSLGQLSIPRARISTISYDAAAGVGSKRAPVQQLDDDAPAPKKRSVNP